MSGRRKSVICMAPVAERPELEIGSPNRGARNRPFGSARRIALRLLDMRRRFCDVALLSVGITQR